MQKAVPKYHPVATSAASVTVQQHTAPANVVLWAGWFCPFTQRVWVVLEELGVPYQYKEVNPYLKEPSFLTEISPKGLTPGLCVDEKPLHDSVVINEFLNEEFGSNQLLMPKDAYQRAMARLWIDYVNKEVVPAFFRLLQAQPSEPEKQAAALADFRTLLSAVSKEAKGPYFFGEQFSLVDAAIAPWAVRDFIIGEVRGFARTDVQGWNEWATALETRASVERTTSVNEILEFNSTFLQNEGKSLAGKAAAGGQVLP
ncbi:glutathione S-transferase [Trichoderma citrinoviride]|uniref:Glutathione S-transferase n=1 Tax=Trichoderma citrinoviride TaxID=58853 RepID=A0A2T4BC54_9HYPO|nr:glutathione S-transferase [Trichoderma citrinoviride]PTB66913.1 glutathione S-transferase [Trichoderma citrinoviride]